MVRFKNRYLLCEVLFDTDIDQESDIQQLLQPATLRNAIADAIQVNYGDLGSAQTSLNLQGIKQLQQMMILLNLNRLRINYKLLFYAIKVKYVNSVTRLFIIRTARDHIDILWNSINFFRMLGEYKIKIRVLHSSGTIKKQEIVAKRYLSRWMHKMLKNKDMIESVRTNLIQKYETAKVELEALDQ